MYSVNLIKKDIERVNAMMNVISDFADGKPFRICDIPYEKRHNYRVEKSVWGEKFDEPFSFTGSSASALCERGLLEVVGHEKYEYEYENYWGNRTHTCVGERAIYRCTGNTIEDYKNALAVLIPKAILA